MVSLSSLKPCWISTANVCFDEYAWLDIDPWNNRLQILSGARGYNLPHLYLVDLHTLPDQDLYKILMFYQQSCWVRTILLPLAKAVDLDT